MDRQLAVLGSPIEHSKSPAIHHAAYRVLGLNWQYGKFEVREGGLRNFVESLDDQWVGLSLTMPLKDEASRFAVSLDQWAEQTKAVNTLVRTPLGWSGFNTDVFGIIQTIRQASLGELSTILVIGSGATAISAVTAIKTFAPESKVRIFARNDRTRNEVIDYTQKLKLSAKVSTNLKRDASKSNLVISTLPAGALDEFGAQLEKSRFFKPRGALFDVVYKDWPSPIAKAWISKDQKTISGLEMLIWQAVAQIRIFTSGDPQIPLPNEIAVVEAMRHAVSD